MDTWEETARKRLQKPSCPTCGAYVTPTGPDVTKCSAIGCATTVITDKDSWTVYYRYRVYTLSR